MDEGKPLVEYYLFERGGSLRQVLLDTDTADFDDIVNQALSAKNDVVKTIEEDFMPKGEVRYLHTLTGSKYYAFFLCTHETGDIKHGKNLPKVHRKVWCTLQMNGIIVDLSNLTDGLPGRVDELEAKVDFDAVNPLYLSIKGYFCCKFPDVMYRILKDLEYTGIEPQSEFKLMK